MKDIKVTFPGGKRVDAHFNGRTVMTDQPPESGGQGEAAGPFDLFFASLATCCGYYVLEFCHARELSTEGLGVRLQVERDPDRKLFTPIRIEITLPDDFPEKYHNAILKAANLCAVKKHILNPPEFEIRIAGD